MEIDLLKLPIPDWGLCCPSCGYLLRGLPQHRCPECATELDMNRIVQTWTRLRDPQFTGQELPLPDFGLECQSCGQRLAGAKQQVCPACDHPFSTDSHRPAENWFVVDPAMHEPLPIPLVESIMIAEYVPFYARERRGAFGASGCDLLVPSEFLFDLRYLITDARRRIERGQSSPIDDAWTCPRCQEHNPCDFQVCWSCQAERDQ